MIVFCFDRDGTVATSRGPVPIGVIQELAKEHPVYAIGNQRLTGEAGIPGVGWREASDHVRGGIRAGRLRVVEAKHPDADQYVHVDDVDVGAGSWERWVYYRPQAFLDAYEAGRL